VSLIFHRRRFLRTGVQSVMGAVLACPIAAAIATAATSPEVQTAMNPPKKDRLVSVLQAAGHPPRIVTGEGGASLAVLPHGGRILGLFGGESDTNFLWTNPALSTAATAKAYFASDDWHNSGGDRTWLAPEVDFFLPNFPDISTYFQPRGLDPGNYQVTSGEGQLTGGKDRQGSDAEVSIRNELQLESKRAAQQLKLRITKTVRMVENPLGNAPQADLRGQVEFAGYRLHTTLQILNPAGRATSRQASYVGIWNLLQLPHGGQMLIPTYYRSVPTTFFGEIPGEDIQSYDRMIRYTMRAPGEQKISVRALASTGRAGYMFRQGDESCLVVRNFNINPSGAYVDVWGTRLDDDGYAIQACNINNSELGSFSELEYHAPAVGGDTGQARSDDVSVVWAFRGTETTIRAVAGLLLGD